MVWDDNLDGYAAYCTDGEWWCDENVTFCEFECEYISPNNIDDYFTSDWDGELYPNSERVTATDAEDNESNVSKDEVEDDDDYVQVGNTGTYRHVTKEEVEEVV
jgi:hypothetical protein